MASPLKLTLLLILTASFAANLCYATRDTSEVSKPIRFIVKKIAAYKTVDSRAVGYAGTRTEQFNRFFRLCQQATDQELVVLTDYNNAKVRAYAFWALAKRNYADIKTILEKHLADTSSFDLYSGCIMMTASVNHFFLDILTPNYIDIECYKLSKEEVGSYYKRIKNVNRQSTN